jgi:hypothetical protein
LMRAFHGKQYIKDFYLTRVRAHRAADELVHGYYWRGGKGCALGCTIHDGNPGAYERMLGIPQILARLEDSIFERLSAPADQAWPEAFLDAIPVGADLAYVWPQFFLRLATDTTFGLLAAVQAPRFAQQKAVIHTVINMYAQWIREKNKPAAGDVAMARRMPASAWTPYVKVDVAADMAAAAATRVAVAAAEHVPGDAVNNAAALVAEYAEYAEYAVSKNKRNTIILWLSELLLACLRQ